MLNTAQKRTIYIDASLGRPTSVPGKEAEEYRKFAEADIAQMKRMGQYVSIPNELE